jgi:hypothetical protein
MKTTIDIGDALLLDAKRFAAEHRVTLRELVEDGLRRTLAARRAEVAREMPDASVDGLGVQPGIDEGDWTAIRELIYEGRGG